MESVLVLTGVHGLRDAALADAETKPTYVVAHLGELLEDYPQPHQEGDWWVCRAARVRIRDGAWDREGPSGQDGWTLDAGRAALAALAGMPSDSPTALRRRLADALPAQQ
jgi:glycerol 3-phosphatase-2